MKTLPLVLITITLCSSAFAAEAPHYRKLLCSADGELMTITGLGTGKLSAENSDLGGEVQIPSTTDGDCANRKTYCSQDGQWMINIPADLAAGTKLSGHVWQNSDVDDRPENRRLGDRYDCIALN